LPPTLSKVELTGRRIIIGEGDGDSTFLKYLCQVRGIGDYQFWSAKGNTDFGQAMRAVIGATGSSRLESVILVADNDETPGDNFASVRRQIPDAWPRPNNPLERARRNGAPNVVILMIPYPRIGDSSHGCLESMLLQAAEAQLVAQVDCLNAYCDCIGTNQWTRTSRDKMRLRCLVSASYPEDPNAGLQYSLKPDRNLIPLTHSYFDDMEFLLRHFDDWMASTFASWQDWRANHPPNPLNN
jgi:hypothetical protein